MTSKVLNRRYRSNKLFGDDNWHMINILDELNLSTFNPFRKAVVRLNGQWVASNNSVVNSLAGSSYSVFMSNSNYNVNSANAVMYIDFISVSDNLTLKVMSRGENGYDYAIVSLDGVSLYSNTGNTGAAFTNISVASPNNKTMTITYRKDGSAHSDLDRAFIAIPSDIITEIIS